MDCKALGEINSHRALWPKVTLGYRRQLFSRKVATCPTIAYLSHATVRKNKASCAHGGRMRPWVVMALMALGGMAYVAGDVRRERGGHGVRRAPLFATRRPVAVTLSLRVPRRPGVTPWVTCGRLAPPVVGDPHGGECGPARGENTPCGYGP